MQDVRKLVQENAVDNVNEGKKNKISMVDDSVGCECRCCCVRSILVHKSHS